MECTLAALSNVVDVDFHLFDQEFNDVDVAGVDCIHKQCVVLVVLDLAELLLVFKLAVLVPKRVAAQFCQVAVTDTFDCLSYVDSAQGSD